jgi:lipopolysaccharide/colanic/teichoic acid biosynthesis glycosyltransferase
MSWAVKRALDVAVALPALVLLSPVMLVVAGAVAVKLGRPVLFRQKRPGLHSRPFTIFKFRTMTDSRGPDGSLLPDSERLPPFGQWLRSTSLDELPELWNVLVGDMSLVGPRPLMMQYVPLYSERQARRHDVRPGVTGWAQVNGRNAISWDEKLEMDVWYIENWSLGLDFRILAATLRSIVRREGIAAEGSATMPEFTGSGRDVEAERAKQGRD